MDELNKVLFNCLVDLDTFSRLTPNTDVHLSKTNFFVPTCGKLSNIMGAQTISNIYNGYTPERLIMDLNVYSERLLDTINKMYKIACEEDDDDIKVETFRKINILYREFNYAYGNNYGLSGLIETYKNTYPNHCYEELKNCIQHMKINIYNIYNLTKIWNKTKIENELPYCPESDFDDNDWELYIKNSTHLQYESTSLYKFYVLYYSSFFYNQ